MFGASAWSRSADLLQLGGQLLLAGRLALLPLAVLVPDRAPAASLLTGRVHGDPVLQLDDFTAAAGGGAPRPVPFASTRPVAVRAVFNRAAAGRAARRGPVVGFLWGS